MVALNAAAAPWTPVSVLHQGLVEGGGHASGVFLVEGAPVTTDSTQAAAERVEEGASNSSDTGPTSLDSDDALQVRVAGYVVSCLPSAEQFQFGFLRPSHGRPDVFFHRSDLRDGTTLEVGDAVEYGLGEYDDRTKALDIVKLDADRGPRERRGGRRRRRRGSRASDPRVADGFGTLQ